MTESPAVGETLDIAALSARITALETENAQLAGASSSRARPQGTRWRAFVSALCIVIAALLVPVSVVSAWARVQLVDEEAFVATLAPLIDDPAVQGMVIDETMTAITAQVDFAELTANVFDAVADLGLPPRAAGALQLLQAPAASGLENLVRTTVTDVIESDAFADVWATATRGAHRALTLASTSDGGGLVVRTPDGVGIQLGAIVEQVKQKLLDRGLGVAELIPTVDRVIILGEGDNLAAVRTGYAVVSAVGYWLPFATLALFGLGILIARRRSAAVLGTGFALAIGGGSLALGLSFGSVAMGIVAGQLDLSPSALEVIYGRLVDRMAQTAAVIALIGVFVAILGWFLGGSRGAASLRGTISSLNTSARSRLAARGLDTGAFGAWIGRQRVFVRSLVAVLAVVWLFALRPFSVSDVALVIVVSVVVAWVLELLQKRAAKDADVTDTETVLLEPETADAAARVAAASGSNKD
ncbi:hypothetical protein QL996_06650 [Planococcus sp. APC 4015]|nr:hypothetical protein [Planococcus sp. APC 4015]